jgi:hypothetical protein
MPLQSQAAPRERTSKSPAVSHIATASWTGRLGAGRVNGEGCKNVMDLAL